MNVWISQAIREDDGSQIDTLDPGTRCQREILVSLVHNVGDVGRVSASVTLCSDMERLGRVFGETVEEQLEEGINVLASDGAGVDLGIAIGVRETNVDWLVKEENVGVGVPAVLVEGCVGSVVGYTAWSKFEQKSSGGTATGAAIQPKKQRGILGRVARFKEPI